MTVILVMGVPGAGKTTLCRGLRQMRPDEVIVISLDDTLPLEGEMERERRKRAEEGVKEEMRRGKGVILVDDVFYLQSMRRPFERAAKAQGRPFGVLFVETGKEEAIRRDVRRERPVGSECIARAAERMERDEKAIVYKSGEDLQRITQWIESLSESWREPRRERTRITPTTEDDPLLRVDLQLRRIIGSMVQDGKDGRTLARVKKKLLGELKEGKEEMEENRLRKMVENEYDHLNL